ncbi:hypothetical protein [Pararhodobacter aggregans]|uniref:Uncharacterized protein n=1 Tax=Pararhodobacter aggregans TaxID=404875 RepID=A0A2T7UMM8_9RHOB|nr:hypothetical protein [Pararhodobacter aggregans]PTW99420.1 hypothetical protein C8N33_11561 [Pararhodobacter aggregans]PVE45960.1 hypothetical protein DDE23_19300 [Pararhodobacter aggregans]
MTTPDWIKPGLYGALIGAVAVAVLGFTWGGWVTGGTAHDQAMALSRNEVAAAMVPVCLGMAERDPDRLETLATIRAATSYRRRDALMATGWATMPGTEAPNRDVAQACLAALEVDAMPETPASAADEG